MYRKKRPAHHTISVTICRAAMGQLLDFKRLLMSTSNKIWSAVCVHGSWIFIFSHLARSAVLG